MFSLRLAWLALALLAACADPDPSAGAPAQTPEELVRLLHVAVDEVAARAEHDATEVTFQHILIGVTGGVPQVTRSPGEAEILAGELLARARAGEDFDLLVKNHTNDVHPGIYTLTTTGTPDPARSRFARSGMVPGVGDVAWRLAVGELGVAPYDGGVAGGTPRCALGYHVVKRLK